jgi:GNAT superfamily N-acetyltransferase
MAPGSHGFLPRLDATGRMAPFHSGTPESSPPTESRLAARAFDVLRKQGPRVFWTETLARLIYRRYHLVELRLVGPLPSAKASEPLEIEEIPPSRSDEHRPFWPELHPAYFERCFAAGYRCFIARVEGRPLAVSWSAHDRIWSDFLECQIPLADDEAYGFGTYVLPEARGNGIAPALMSYRARILADAGNRRLFHLVEPTNRANTRVIEKLGDQLVAVIGHYRLGGRRWLFCRYRPGFTPPGGD